MKKKLIIIVTVPVVLQTWLKGQAKFLSQYYEVEIITSNSNNIDNIQKYENVNINIVDLKVLLIYFFKVKHYLYINSKSRFARYDCWFFCKSAK